MARKKNPEKRMGLGGHLRELRNRLFWSALFIMAGAVVGWMIFDQVFDLLQAPVVRYAAENDSNTTINFGSVTGAFDLRMQTSIFLGVLLASPFWLYNLWAFITPGLKKKERRYTIAFLGTAVPLFAAGCWLAWVSLPYFIASLISFTPSGAANVINANEYVLFTIRVLLVFGIAFVLPAVLVLLNFIGILSAASILKSWRLAVFISAIIAALATPVSDPMSMLLVMVPMILLYFLSAGIAMIHDKRAAKRAKALGLDLDELDNLADESDS
ncbi:MAG: twin-arginine translocase subunit TatC [Rhodoluna sp.]|nr:twin-arginine translocase subunit TatC [Rhodoluna sp.]MBP7818860.1 twin-arginine translocase subunit TatC [Rhodoluna sp.]